MSSSTRNRLLVLLVLLAVVFGWREREIRRHEDDLDDWPRRGDA
ncbi:MAG: hypothetical protein AAGE98_20705 [Actinomycetota bacterium]